MRLVIIADVFPPLRSSGATQLRDLSFEMVRQGHEVTMMVASPELNEPWRIEIWNGVQVIRLKTLKTKDVGYVRRTLGELLMSFFMLRNLRKSPLGKQKWDGVVWYSPTIFLGPIVNALKTVSGCRSYLIVRDIFPEWAVDIGLMGRGLAYLFLKTIANYQYSVADVIGIQSQGNSTYFSHWQEQTRGKIEVLQNWLTETPMKKCSISVVRTSLAGRKIFVYAGNMGVAQGMGILLDLAIQFKNRMDIGFLFVGRGSDMKRLQMETKNLSLENILFFDEIDPDEISGLYAQCHFGLIALDPRHKTHNIPGKFLSYMQAGLPVLASVNDGNDLVDLIKSENVGLVCADATAQALKAVAEKLIDDVAKDTKFAERCNALSKRLFSSDVAAIKIVKALQG